MTLDKLNFHLLTVLGLSHESAEIVMDRITGLERERDACADVLRKANAWITEAKPLLEKGGEAERERDELAAWKAEMLLVESRWDCQRVAKLLGIELGQDIRPNIEPKIRELIEARHQVETKLNDALAELHRYQCIERGETPPP